MRTRDFVCRLWKPAAFSSLLAGLLIGVAPPARANTPQTNIFHGRMWNSVDYDGGDGWDSYMIYPAGLPVNPNPSGYVLTRQFLHHSRKGGTYCMTTDWTDPYGATWPNTVSYFHRSQNYAQPPYFNGAFNYLWPLGMKRQYRWKRPDIIVNDTLKIEFEGPIGTNSVYPSYGNDLRPPFETVPSLPAEMVSETVWRYVPGVRLNRRIYSYPYGSPDQDYQIWDIVLTNDGIHGDPDTLVGTAHRGRGTASDSFAIPTQTINHLEWWQVMSLQNSSAQVVDIALHNDISAMFIQPWPGFENAASLAWDEDDPTFVGPDWGDPAPEAYDYLMMGNAWMLHGPLFVSTGPGASFSTNLPGQPLFREYYWERAFDLAGAGYSPADVDGQRDMSSDGTLQMPLNLNYQDNALLTGLRNDQPGPVLNIGYGPAAGAFTAENARLHGWNIPPGDSVRIVQLVAAGGIDVEESRRISKYFYDQKALHPEAPDTWMTADDIALYMTGKDTALKAANVAYWNFYGQFAPGVTSADLAKWGIPNYTMSKLAAYNQPYNVPDPPRPPSYLYVNTPLHGGVVLKWGNEAETTTDFDTGVNDFAGYRVWRQEGSRLGKWNLIASGPASKFQHNGSEIEWYNTAATPGVLYWYAVTAYDDGTQNWANPGVSLESDRYWLWTNFMPGTSVTPLADITGVEVRPGGYELAIQNNAPNPFNPVTVINYSLDRNYEQVSLRVYDVLGREVRTLVAQKALLAGLHQATWDGRDAAGREAGSGVYMARLVTPNGARSIRMLLVR